MADFYAVLNKGKGVTVASTINIADSQAFEIEFEYKWSGTDLGRVFGNNGNLNNRCILSNSAYTMQVISGSAATATFTLGTYERTSYNVFKITRDTSNLVEVFINGVSKGTSTIAGSFTITRFFQHSTSYVSDAGMRYFKLFLSGSLSHHYLATANDSANWPEIISAGNGTIFNPLDPITQHWELYTTGTGAVSFSGTVDTQLVESGASGSFGISDYFSGSGTPFTYQSVGTALPSGFSLNGTTGVVSYNGTQSIATTNSVVIQATANDESTAQTNPFTIDVTDTASLVPQGTVTITGVTTSNVTGNVAFSYSDTDETGYEYSLDLGAATEIITNPHTIADLTSGQTYSVRVRAVNSYGSGAWSAAVEFTTTVGVALATGVIKNETLTVLADTVFTTVDVYSQSTGALIARFTDVTSSPAGVIAVSSDFTAGVTYRLWYELSSGDWGTEKVVAV